MTSSSKKILVTGADGFIGSHLTETLVRQGHSVKAFVYYNSFNSNGWLDQSPKEILSELEIFAGDIRDPNGVRTALTGCDQVFHLAALIGIPYSYHSPDSYVDTNIKGTLNVLQAARDLGLSRVIQTSTSEVYGTAQFVPITEEHPLQGQSPYAATKIGADQLALSFHRSFETPVTVLRPFNTYGPRQSTRALIPTIITQLMSGSKRLRLGSVHPTRDFSFVADTVAAFISVAKTDKTLGKVINSGSNFEISVGKTAELIGKTLGVDFEIETEDKRIRPADSEVERLWASNALAKELAGWSPQYGGLAGFERGIEETVRWFKDPKNMQAYKNSGYTV